MSELPFPDRPNVLITGTPGTGKTTLCEMVVSKCPELVHVNVGDRVREMELHTGWNEEFQCHDLDEDKLVDHLEEEMVHPGGRIVDFHSPDVFPERWFKRGGLIIVLRTPTAPLYDRLVKRGYSEKKVQENMEAEIMQVVLEEARESYPSDETQVVELASSSVEELESNADRIVAWWQQAKNQ